MTNQVSQIGILKILRPIRSISPLGPFRPCIPYSPNLRNISKKFIKIHDLEVILDLMPPAGSLWGGGAQRPHWLWMAITSKWFKWMRRNFLTFQIYFGSIYFLGWSQRNHEVGLSHAKPRKSAFLAQKWAQRYLFCQFHQKKSYFFIIWHHFC